MANYTITLDAEQDRALAWIVERTNTENKTSFTVEQFLRKLLKDGFHPYVLRYREFQKLTVKDAYELAAESVQAQVRSLLGVP